MIASFLNLLIAEIVFARLNPASEKFQCFSMTNWTIEGEAVSVTLAAMTTWSGVLVSMLARSLKQKSLLQG